MQNYLNQIALDLVKDTMRNYWPGFEPVAFAIYNRHNVYLFNHPKFKADDYNSYHIIEKDDQFNGSCTLILYLDFPTAIVNIELYSDYESMYSLLVHELFHGFQYLKEENRFADEIMGITYPLSKENVELRNQERTNLYKALLESNMFKKKKYLNQFIALREKRAAQINEYLQYENLIETFEGPAWYVELKAYCEKSPLDYHLVVQRYGRHLIDKFEATADIRRSCYSSGMFMCLLLDEFLPGWKDKFFLNTKITLFDLIKQASFDYEKFPVGCIEISSETGEVIDITIKNRKKVFDEFNKKSGFHLFIEGKIAVKSFDPMNIVPLEDRFLHKSFIKIMMNDAEYLFQQPVITYIKDSFQSVYKLHLVVKHKPVETTNSLIVDGIGEIKGMYKKQNEVHYLYLSQ